MFLLNPNKMYTIFFAIVALAFFMLYNTSKKVKFDKQCNLTNWIRNNKQTARITAYSLLSLTLIGEIMYEGLGVGSLTFFIYIMFIGPAIMVVYPTLPTKPSYVAGLLGISLIVETLIFA